MTFFDQIWFSQCRRPEAQNVASHSSHGVLNPPQVPRNGVAARRTRMPLSIPSMLLVGAAGDAEAVEAFREFSSQAVRPVTGSQPLGRTVRFSLAAAWLERVVSRVMEGNSG